jgi:hypothetical protein
MGFIQECGVAMMAYEQSHEAINLPTVFQQPLTETVWNFKEIPRSPLFVIVVELDTQQDQSHLAHPLPRTKDCGVRRILESFCRLGELTLF